MKQRIPLTPQNIQVLVDRHGIPAEQLTRQYWERYVINNQEEMTRVFANQQKAMRNGFNKDIQVYISRRAGRLLRENIRVRVGLPKPSGCTKRQRLYHKTLLAAGLHSTISTKE
jgi:hypothetical protein